MTKKRFRKVLGLIEDSNGDLLDLSEIADKMNQLNNENEQLKKEKENLKKELWESEKAYIEETNHSAIDIERDIAWLKEEFEREYWND